MRPKGTKYVKGAGDSSKGETGRTGREILGPPGLSVWQDAHLIGRSSKQFCMGVSWSNMLKETLDGAKLGNSHLCCRLQMLQRCMWQAQEIVSTPVLSGYAARARLAE